MLNKLIKLCLNNQFIVLIVLLITIAWGLIVAPFNFNLDWLPRNPIPVDAIPDIGENQQIVFTKWEGRSPKDVEEQITYPLTASLLAISNVKTVRSYSMFGFSTIYVIFDEKAEYYWSRTRVLEKLNSLSSGLIPEGVTPTLGPDATALGQIFWYTLEGHDESGNPTGGWDLQELRSIQDWTVRYALQSVDGVAEVSSIGGFVKEYQIDVNPNKIKEYDISLTDVYNAVRSSNKDVGARTIEINRSEYVVRGVGTLQSVEDIESIPVKVVNNTPLYLKDIANISIGPQLRRGVLDKGGSEAVGGIVVARYGENPLSTIEKVKSKINEISVGLPKKTLDDGRISQVSIIPFYDRTELINETLNTLNMTLKNEILITIIVILIMVMHFRSSLVISGMLPLTVLVTFIGMKLFDVDANIVALSGIAIAIGTVVDIGIVVTENILKHVKSTKNYSKEVVFKAVSEVSGAVFTAIMTTVISFIPVFTMIGTEGKLFKPLAYTKTFALIASVLIAFIILPTVIYNLMKLKHQQKTRLQILERYPWMINGITICMIAFILSSTWSPLSLDKSLFSNFIFTLFTIGIILGGISIYIKKYPVLLKWALDNKSKFLSIPIFTILFGLIVWIGTKPITNWLPQSIKSSSVVVKLDHMFPGIGKEFMPHLDEGSFLYMPTTMPHAGMEESLDVLQTLDKAMYSIPEVDMVVGKIGRADSPLDPAPLNMVETIVTYKPKYTVDKNGERIRQWREHIHTADDIWNELVKVAQIPGTTSAPKLQPISARLVMLQSGLRAPMGIKVRGPDLKTIEEFGYELERYLKNAPGVKREMVFFEKVIGKPYLEVHLDREAIAKYGISIDQAQNTIEIALGGKPITTMIEGRARYPVRVRYMHDYRDNVESLENVLISGKNGVQIPLKQLSTIKYVKGPQVIKSEDTFLTGYVLFDKLDDLAEVDVVKNTESYLKELIKSGDLVVPSGVSYSFAGSYQNQIRSMNTLKLVLPLALMLIVIILYIHFKNIATSFITFGGVFLAWSGGFIMLWLYGQNWFLNFDLFGINFRDLFHVHPVNLSVAVWVGFLALFGIATDDGVLVSTVLEQQFIKKKPKTISAVRKNTVKAAMRRIRPAMMTTATTLLALLPILTSSGRGSDVMIPMAIPSFGGMLVAILTTLFVPVIYALRKEFLLKRNK